MKKKLPLILLIFSCFLFSQENLNIHDIYFQELISISEDEFDVNSDSKDLDWRKSVIEKITSENYREPSFLKTAMVLHMLKYKLGDETYNDNVDAYLLKLNEDNSSMSIKDFQLSIEERTGEDLSDFFNDWFVGKGFPSYEISWFQNKKTNEVNFVVSQIQSDASVAFFEMPVPIKVSNNNGDSQIIRLELSENKQSFTGKLPFEIDNVVVDPEHHLISKNNTVKNGVDQQVLSTNISLYPNPAKNALNIQNGSDAIVEKISIYDMLGKLVLEESNPLLAINLKPLSFGIHLVKIETNQGVLHKTILKEQ
ncbi:T9SS type A sorting domain-containing protein [Aureibaculum sp. 2210JD6-5]|uniref:T9SS type A sorting domain-containing protein n=1 Tax=Aureibaculum sp. 2210JD6-5 TaxID=3103957 RepID=UPI002AAD60FA|nr:T9SS type A sorting domain-containing protein [Aureibaculum sp. 2210JD6-5]MDY7395742.1 T9SS type A sorting domain-containing protein [Aureibaculum sp. 2210JD6-5]